MLRFDAASAQVYFTQVEQLIPFLPNSNYLLCDFFLLLHLIKKTRKHREFRAIPRFSVIFVLESLFDKAFNLCMISSTNFDLFALRCNDSMNSSI